MNKTKFKKIFKVNNPVIGMIHIRALPGTPNYKNNNNEIIEMALKEAEIYFKAGIDSLALENMHDVPYIKGSVGHEITSMMSIIGYEIKKHYKIPCGIQILAAANKEALAVAKAANLDFIRAEGFVFGHLADEGYIDSCAGDLLRYRKQISAEYIAVFTDIKKKHSSHSITSDISILDTAKAAEFFLSDGVIVTGTGTGKEVDLNELKSVKKYFKGPVIIGSGVTIDNLDKYFYSSDAMIIGSWFKKNGYWANKLEYDRVAKFMLKVNKLRAKKSH